MKTARISEAWGSKEPSSTEECLMTSFVSHPTGTASDAEVDSYAQRVIRDLAEAGSEPDASLGPYITSVLRSTNTETPLSEIIEYESLIELIQEHCWVDTSQASSILEKIFSAVRTRELPLSNKVRPFPPSRAGDTLIPGNSPSAENNAPFPPLGSSGNENQADHCYAEYQMPVHDAYQIEQAFESSVEILLSMNPDISEDAARQALHLVQGDVNWGQYLIDVALTVPPVCRHLLHDGCYRRDCQFSHDIDGHTCVFWLRGRCTKGETCPFRHGFNEKALESVLPPAESYNESIEQSHQTILNTDDPPLPSATGTLASGNSTTANIWGRTTSTSFAQVASQGAPPASEFPFLSKKTSTSNSNVRRVDIPQDLWHAHENRDSAVFYINDPLERYNAVAQTVKRKNVVDLHFQSTKTFAVVLESVLPEKLRIHSEVWIVTGTGHHVSSKTHQKGGGALENAVISWLTKQGYKFARGRDRNGLGGALLVQR